MIKCFFIIIAMTALSLFAENVDYSLDADHIDYQNKLLNLKGNVIIQRGLAKMTCAFATIKTDDHQKDIIEVILQGDVKLAIDENSYILCDRGEINFLEGKGILSTNETNGQIEYFKQPDLRLKCNKLLIDCPKKEFDRITAIGKISIQKVDHYTVFGHEAIHEKIGRISVYPEPIPHAYCTIKTFHNTEIQAQNIHFDPEKNTIIFHASKGRILFDGSNKIDFLADTVIWNEDKNTLTMQGNIRINQNNLASLFNNDRVVFNYNEKELHQISACGHTEIQQFLNDGLVHYHLISDGDVCIDNHQKKITIEKNEKQIQFLDALGSIFGDKLEINYAEQNQSLLPERISLVGHVKLIGAGLDGGNDLSSAAQYALADELEYLFVKKELRLQSNHKKRVLFYDKINHMQISAPGIIYSKGKTFGEDVIKGLGDVRFSFIEQELSQIKKRFNFMNGESQ